MFADREVDAELVAFAEHAAPVENRVDLAVREADAENRVVRAAPAENRAVPVENPAVRAVRVEVEVVAKVKQWVKKRKV